MAGRLDLDSYQTYKKTCSFCHRRVPSSWTYELCQDCLKRELFPAVAEYIRKNNVNEIEVAEHFGIDRFLVREWIREGRLQHRPMYRPDDIF